MIGELLKPFKVLSARIVNTFTPSNNETPECKCHLLPQIFREFDGSVDHLIQQSMVELRKMKRESKMLLPPPQLIESVEPSETTDFESDQDDIQNRSTGTPKTVANIQMACVDITQTNDQRVQSAKRPSDHPLPFDGKRRRSVTIAIPSKSAPISTVPRMQSTKLPSISAKRQAKIRKTISAAENAMKSPVKKNTNKQIHLKSDLYRSLCIFCDRYEKNLVTHYVNAHPDREVPIARPSPIMAHRLRMQLEPFEEHNHMITGFCYFCDEIKSTRKYGWQYHLLNHTGEFLFHCSECDGNFKAKNQHDNCSGEPINIFDANKLRNDDSLYAFMCKECNYTQIKRERMIKHITAEHGYSDAANWYEQLCLVPDLAPVNLKIPFDYADAGKCFACTICSQQLNNANEFLAHFDEQHDQANEYGCFCGAQLTLPDFNLSGSYVCAHLNVHSADIFVCMVCDQQLPTILFTENETHKHLLNSHPKDRFHYKHIHRESNERYTIVECKITTIKCQLCKMQFDDLATSEIHFKTVHSMKQVTLTISMHQKSFDVAKKIVRSCLNAFRMRFDANLSSLLF